MKKCPICKGTGLVKKKLALKSPSKKDYYSRMNQYGLYKECENCIGSGKIKK